MRGGREARPGRPPAHSSVRSPARHKDLRCPAPPRTAHRSAPPPGTRTPRSASGPSTRSQEYGPRCPCPGDPAPPRCAPPSRPPHHRAASRRDGAQPHRTPLPPPRPAATLTRRDRGAEGPRGRRGPGDAGRRQGDCVRSSYNGPVETAVGRPTASVHDGQGADSVVATPTPRGLTCPEPDRAGQWRTSRRNPGAERNTHLWLAVQPHVGTEGTVSPGLTSGPWGRSSG